MAWSRLGGTFFIPLLCSPLLALVLVMLAYPPLRRARRALNVTPETCVCVGKGEFVPVQVAGTCDASGVAAMTGGDPLVTPIVDVDTSARCVERYRGSVAGISAAVIADRLHYLSAGAVRAVSVNM